MWTHFRQQWSFQTVEVFPEAEYRNERCNCSFLSNSDLQACNCKFASHNFACFLRLRVYVSQFRKNNSSYQDCGMPSEKCWCWGMNSELQKRRGLLKFGGKKHEQFLNKLKMCQKSRKIWDANSELQKKCHNWGKHQKKWQKTKGRSQNCKLLLGFLLKCLNCETLSCGIWRAHSKETQNCGENLNWEMQSQNYEEARNVRRRKCRNEHEMAAWSHQETVLFRVWRFSGWFVCKCMIFKQRCDA